MNVSDKFDITRIRTLYLMMGFNCNFRCRHCIQDGCNTIIREESVISQDTIDYLNRLIDIRPDSYNKIRLMFWGGEPLLYWKIIKEVISMFGDKFKYSMVTNGSLLTQDKVNFINEHEISVALSYDGENTEKVRRINILQDKSKLDLFKQIKSKSVCAVISAYNYDYQKMFDHIDKLIDKDIRIFFENILVTWEMPKDLYSFDLEDYRNKLHQLAIQAKQDILSMKLSRAVDFFFKYLQDICNINKEDSYTLHCGQMYRVINLDLKGNLYSCHNMCNPIGTVKDDRISLVLRQDKWVERNIPKTCMNCQYYPLCKGGCPNELVDKDGERYSCKISKIIFDEVLWLTNELESGFTDVDLG